MPAKPRLSAAAFLDASETTRRALLARLTAMPGRPAAQEPVKGALPRMEPEVREAKYRPPFGPLTLAQQHVPRRPLLTGPQARRLRHKARAGRGEQ
jgi:hypothetical protein